MLVMPAPAMVPDAVWEAAETEEMKEVVKLYGKVYHLWQVERGDQLPLGEPRLMTSFTEAGQLDLEGVVKERDEYFKSSTEKKREIRKGIEMPELHEDLDSAWKN